MSKLAHSDEVSMEQIEARAILDDHHNMENEANEFAMCLLMPENFVREEVAKLGGIDIEDTKKLNKLAARFRVSPQIMAIRLGQLSATEAPPSAPSTAGTQPDPASEGSP